MLLPGRTLARRDVEDTGQGEIGDSGYINPDAVARFQLSPSKLKELTALELNLAKAFDAYKAKEEKKAKGKDKGKGKGKSKKGKGYVKDERY